MPLDYVLDNAGENNVIFLGGGDPSIYSGIETLVKMLIEKGNLVVVSTNGIVYRDFFTSENLQLQVSLPAFDEILYKKITGRDCVDEVKQNILSYKKNHITFVNFPAYESNFYEIEPVSDFCKEHDIPLVVSPLIPVGSLKPVSKSALERKCLEIKLSKNVELYFSRNRENRIEYYFPGNSGGICLKNIGCELIC